MRVASVTVSVVVLASAALMQPVEAREKARQRPATRIDIVDWRAPRAAPTCAIEIYPYAPSTCLAGGFIEFDGKAYFAPTYGYRAQRYVDGW